jgi:hypothetical protein
MPEPPQLTKARLEEIRWNDEGEAVEVDESERKVVTVQFNPQTLKVNYTNQKSGGDQRGGSAIQFVGRGTTKLSLDLWFDVTVLDDAETNDVRLLTKDVAYFITPKEQDRQGDNEYIPPGLRFIWGSFLFEGVMDSMNENLEFFSEDGRPLRAGVSISLSRQEIQFRINRIPPSGGGDSTPGTQPQSPARSGDSVQQMAARAGRPQDWKAIAAANAIENPRLLEPGTLLNLNVKAQVKAGASLKAGVSAGASASAGVSASVGTSASVSVGASIRAG